MKTLYDRKPLTKGIPTLVASVVLATCFVSQLRADGRPSKPNIIIMMADDMPELVQELDRLRGEYLESVDAETVTLTRRNYVELLEGGWIENGRKRLAKLKAELAADTDNKQKAFKVDVSQNHVNFQDRQLERSKRLIRMHEEHGTADQK